MGKRHIFVLLAHLACFMISVNRYSFSIILVSMIKTSPSILPFKIKSQEIKGHHHSKYAKSNSSIRDVVEFVWSEKEQGFLKSGFFHGYTCTILFGGMISSRWSGRWVFAIGLFVASILTLLIPIAARTNYFLFYSVRVLIGVCQGLTFPGIQTVLKEWTPLNEKTTLSAIAYSGLETGTVASLVIGGIICQYFGWSSLCYGLGISGIIFVTIWLNFVSDSPQTHPSISNEERQYISSSQYDEAKSLKCKEGPKVPWWEILTSGPVWALSIGNFVHNWVYYLAIGDIPSYFHDVMNMPALENGLKSGIPFFFSFFTQIAGSVVADLLIRKGCSVTITRKFILSLGFLLSAIVLCLFGYVGSKNKWLSFVLLVLLVGFANVTTAGYDVNQLDIAPRYAGVIWSIKSFIGNSAGMVVGVVTGYVTNNHPTRHYYRIVFMIAAGVSMFGILFYCLFGSGTEQEWNRIADDEEDDDRADATSDQRKPLISSE